MSASDLLSMIFSSNPAEKATAQRPQEQSLYSSAMNYLQNNQAQVQKGANQLDIERMQKTHNQVYGSGGTKAPDANDLGATAVIDVLKKFGGGSGDVSGKGAQNPAQFQALAMQQASQLYDQQSANGNVRSGTDKQSAVTSAAMMAVKMLAKSQLSGSGGGGGMGGAGSILQLAGKFLS